MQRQYGFVRMQAYIDLISNAIYINVNLGRRFISKLSCASTQTYEPDVPVAKIRIFYYLSLKKAGMKFPLLL